MKLKPYIHVLPYGGAKKLAEKLGISSSYLSQIASGRVLPAPSLCVLIERATNGDVPRQDLRPQDYADIWPELTERVLPDRPSGETTGQERIR